MEAFILSDEERWDAKKHVEHILGEVDGGDYTIACWEPGQISPHHTHPDCTEIYLCVSGRGIMNIPGRTIDIIPGAFCVHPPGLHQWRWTHDPVSRPLWRTEDNAQQGMAWQLKLET
jgi:mannose-6-phosphate isomerase-like protein (cupin superfamily)